MSSRTALGLGAGGDSALAACDDLAKLSGGEFATVLADPPWRFMNRTGKVAPEHRRLTLYDTMATADVCALPVADVVADAAHLYLWVPNALLAEGLRVILRVMKRWGFDYPGGAT